MGEMWDSNMRPNARLSPKIWIKAAIVSLSCKCTHRSMQRVTDRPLINSNLMIDVLEQRELNRLTQLASQPTPILRLIPSSTGICSRQSGIPLSDCRITDADRGDSRRTDINTSNPFVITFICAVTAVGMSHYRWVAQHFQSRTIWQEPSGNSGIRRLLTVPVEPVNQIVSPDR
jgi:hypothetical protein